MATEAVLIDRRERARKRAKRWARTVKEATLGQRKTKRRVKELTEALTTAHQDRERHGEKLAQLRKELTRAEATHNNADAVKLEKRVAYQQKQQTAAKRRVDAAAEKLEAENARLETLRHRVKRSVTKRRFWRKRITGNVRKLIHLRELRKQRKRGQPEFQPWMANGSDWRNASAGARAYIARAVVLHGLICTSMARTYVPAGGSTTSYHLVWNGGRAGDAAGSMEAMEECQRAEYRRGLGLAGQLEMFGPINDHCLKYGGHLTLAEGDPLENLHDTHVHLAEEDSAVKAALQR